MARESTGAAIGRTVVKAVTFLLVLFSGLFVVPFLLIGALAAIGGAASEPQTGSSLLNSELVAGEPDAEIQLAAVPIVGPILAENPGGSSSLFAPAGVTYGYEVKELLAKLAEDDEIDGVILELDTPGGTIPGSYAISDGVEAYQEATGKPVIAFVRGISASGGMWAMAGADEILADHGTLIGSIGVIFGPFQQFTDVVAIDGGLIGGGVTTEGGIEVEYLSAGRSKDFGNPYRPITDEERKSLQDTLDQSYDEFVEHVGSKRDISEAEIKRDFGALIFSESQAVENGLIDGIANRDEAYERAAEAAGLGDDENWAVQRLQSGEPSFLDLFAARFQGSTPETEFRPVGGALCLGNGTPMAYHGDPLTLCAMPTR